MEGKSGKGWKEVTLMDVLTTVRELKDLKDVKEMHLGDGQ